MVDISVSGNDKYLPVNNKTPPPSIGNVTNIETKKDVQILPVGWDHVDRNTNPPPTINTFKYRQSLLRGSFVNKTKVIHQ